MILSHDETERNNELLAYAIAYVRRGIAVIPLHTPLHNHPDGWRCTCEEYRHDERYRGRGYYLPPGEHCRTPGKHPRLRGAWEEQATTDEAVVRRWWRRWPDANIGIACGPSGLLVLDRDAYKDTYQGDQMESLDDETVTVLTGGGGTHLWYRMADGDTFGNNNSTLPDGVDIRGWGGLVVAPPSLHVSGRCYEFELDYSPGDIEIAPIPDGLRALLEQSQQRASRAGVSTAALADVDMESLPVVDVSGFGLSEHVREMIGQAGRRGQRSERDMTICVALVYAGATDEQIAGVFAHNPCGGKFRERGRQYLAYTIAKARQYCAAHPAADDETVQAVRAFIHSASFGPMVCPLDIYRTDGTDTRVADAVLDVMQERRAWRVRVPLRRLAARAGVGARTVARALDRLSWLFTVDDEYFISLEADTLRAIRAAAADCQALDEYTTRKGSDPYLSGRAKQAGGDEAPLGEAVLRVLSALAVHGSGTRRQIARWTGKSLHTVATATRRAEVSGLVSVELGENRAKMYSLLPDAWQTIDEAAADMRTYRLQIERAERMEEQAQNWTVDRLKRATDPDEIRQLERRLLNSQRLRFGLLAMLHPDWTDDELMQWVTAENGRALPSAEVYAYRREQAAAAAVERIGRRLNGGLLTQRELAELRADMGRLGVDASEYIDEEDDFVFGRRRWNA